MRGGEVALAFRVGNRYFDAGKNRVFECIALKGKKARLVAFGCLDSVEKDLAFLKECPELIYFSISFFNYFRNICKFFSPVIIEIFTFKFCN